MIDQTQFFDNILAPDFIREAFENNHEWYLLVGKFVEILNQQLIDAHTLSETDARMSGKVQIGKSCKIGPYVTIEGPVFIGDNVEIGPNAFIRAGSIICDNCVVGHAALVKNALMMQGAKISNHCALADSIIGSKSRMGGHSESTNRRFDQQPIRIKIMDQQFPTNLDKYGMILGESARLGGGVLVAPGSLIGKRTFIETGLAIGGFIPANKFVKQKDNLEFKDNHFTGELHNNSKFYN